MGTDHDHSFLPGPHAAFLAAAVDRLREDRRLTAVAIGGSYLHRTVDEFSDLDLVIAVEPAEYGAVAAERRAIAARLGPLLAAFTGEHVGEPRLLICLYGPPLLHVDLKFVSLAEPGVRVEDPLILWQRDDRFRAALGEPATFPPPDLQWIEDRFWIWIHYGAGKVGRGELFDAIELLALLRSRALGPLVLARAGARPAGVRKIESAAPELAEAMRATVATHDPRAVVTALEAAAALYRKLREPALEACSPNRGAEDAAMAYLAEIAARIESIG